MVEANQFAFATLDANKKRGVRYVADWPVEQADVREIDWRPYRKTIRVVAGGPPCQPFSQAGKALGARDDRDMWPEAMRAVEEISPEAFLFENVRGLMRRVFSDYFGQIIQRLDCGGSAGGYHVVHGMVDAADYGAPQRRHRVIVAGFRRDVLPKAELPQASHSRDRLLWEQWVTGEYWTAHGLKQPTDEMISFVDRGRVAALRKQPSPPNGERWRTVRDALRTLGEPDGLRSHVFQPGARTYPGHTGSDLDQPAKALKAGMHGVPGGENMMKLANGAVRYFTVREMARLQGFPDEFAFPGTWTESTRQLGNAVPVPLARSLGEWVVKAITTGDRALAA
jgi:DNA (cytosine-5)-methyltransferase 1